ncbi:CGNR zinc finger domain-containing protein [Undibacterium sp. TJN25]|uniref:CGNR zinc finger domain-containing protein n=1 Tax=Undibacterium sp. TJN25 TaxID=3413056 RepID=UPI003BF382D4
MFIADASGLDFLNSIATPVDDAIDWIGDGDGLLSWLAQAKLVSPDILAAVKERTMPGELDRVADQARGLREWFRSFVRGHMGQPLTSDALEALKPLNTLLERDEAFSQLVFQQNDGGSGMELQTTRRWRSPESLLLPIAEALAKLICEEDFSYVKACEGHNCTLMFADHTKRRARKWCSMAACGNRAKQAAHRSRLKAQA